MKVALISAFPERPDQIKGGVAGAVKYLADELAKLPDLRLSVVVPQSAPGRQATRERWAGGLEVLRLPKIGRWRRLPGTFYDLLAGKAQIERALEELSADVAHFHAMAFLAADCARPHVLTIHGIAEKDAAWDRRPPPARWLKARMLALTEGYGRRVARNVILISEAAKTVLPPGARRRLWRIANPVADSFFEVARRPEAGRIFCSCRVTALKNVRGLIEAFAAARGRGLGARLRVAGAADEPYLASCRETARALGVEGAVEFLGSLTIPELQDELARAACFALASFQENAPLSLAEALAAGVPVLGPRVGGVPEMLDEGAAGLLADPRDPEEIAQALTCLLREPARAEALAARGREKAERRHRASVVARLTAEVYRELAASKAR